MPYPARYVRIAETRERFGPAVDSYLAASLRCDGLADAAAAALVSTPPEVQRQWSLTLLPDSAPAALKQLVESVAEPPPWADFDSMTNGGAVVLRGGIFSAAALLCYALPLGYLSPAGTRPLVMNGGLTHHVTRRLLETAKFLVETCRPKGLARDGAGFTRTLTVRLMHARVRAKLLKAGTWDHAWGAPINQADMLATNLMFSVGGLDALRALGFSPTDDELRGYFAMWRLSGHLIGVEPALLPATEPDARRLQEMVFSLEPAPDENSRRLTRALLDAPLLDAGADGKTMHALMVGLTRGFLGPERAEALAVPSTPFKHVLRAVRPMVRALEVARLQTPGGETLARAAGTRAWQAVLDATPETLPREFSLFRQLSHVIRAA